MHTYIGIYNGNDEAFDSFCDCFLIKIAINPLATVFILGMRSESIHNYCCP